MLRTGNVAGFLPLATTRASALCAVVLALGVTNSAAPQDPPVSDLAVAQLEAAAVPEEAQPAEPEPPPPTPPCRPGFAVQQVDADLTALIAAGELDTTAYRYVWNPWRAPEELALVSFVANSAINRTGLCYQPDVPGSPIQTAGDGAVIRLDFRAFCARQSELPGLLAAWDRIGNPYFMVEAPAEAAPKEGKVYKTIFGPHVPQDAASNIRGLTQGENPILWCGLFYEKALTQIDGGVYYDFLGIDETLAFPRKPEETDQETWLKYLGVTRSLLTQRNSDQRGLVPVSKVTSFPRVIEVFNRPSRPEVNQGLVTISQDVAQQPFYSPDQDPLLNLLRFEMAAQEVVFERDNGHLGYLLFNGQGQLADVVPDNVAHDTRVPPPFRARLEPAISCIRCHGENGEGGFKPFGNVVPNLSKQFDIFDDRSGEKTGLSQADTVRRLAALYSGSFDKTIRRAREDHEEAITRSIPPLLDADGDPWDFEEVMTQLSRRATDYKYSIFTAEKACYELGFPAADKASAPLKLKAILGDPPPLPGTEIRQEDPRLALLLIGEAITRQQWEQVAVDAYARAEQSAQLPVKKDPDDALEKVSQK